MRAHTCERVYSPLYLDAVVAEIDIDRDPNSHLPVSPGYHQKGARRSNRYERTNGSGMAGAGVGDW